MAGEGRLIVAHSLVIVFHGMHRAVDVQLAAVIAYLRRIMSQADENIAECLVGPQVLLFLFLSIA